MQTVPLDIYTIPELFLEGDTIRFNDAAIDLLKKPEQFQYVKLSVEFSKYGRPDDTLFCFDFSVEPQEGAYQISHDGGTSIQSPEMVVQFKKALCMNSDLYFGFEVIYYNENVLCVYPDSSRTEVVISCDQTRVYFDMQKYDEKPFKYVRLFTTRAGNSVMMFVFYEAYVKGSYTLKREFDMVYVDSASFVQEILMGNSRFKFDGRADYDFFKVYMTLEKPFFETEYNVVKHIDGISPKLVMMKFGKRGWELYFNLEAAQLLADALQYSYVQVENTLALDGRIYFHMLTEPKKDAFKIQRRDKKARSFRFHNALLAQEMIRAITNTSNYTGNRLEIDISTYNEDTLVINLQ